MSQNRGQCMEHCHMLMFLRPVSGYSSNIWPTQYNPFTHRTINFSCRTVVLFHTIFGLRTKWRSKYLTPIQRHVYPWLRSYNPRVQAHRIFGPLLSSSTRIPTGCANHIKCLQIQKKKKTQAGLPHCTNWSRGAHKHSRNGVWVTTELPFCALPSDVNILKCFNFGTKTYCPCFYFTTANTQLRRGTLSFNIVTGDVFFAVPLATITNSNTNAVLMYSPSNITSQHKW